GTATSATQVEGHCPASDWVEFARVPGHIRGGDTPDIACDQFHRWREDLALEVELGMSAHRLGVEWARVEPRPGEFDSAAIDHYRAVVGAHADAGITPMLTVHHYTLPTWVRDRGGILASDFVEWITRYARKMVGALGDLCPLWITVNEPNVLAAFGFLMG